MTDVLTLRQFGIAFGGRVLLSSVNLTIPETGITVLAGPAGTGKSTLVRTLAGHNDASPALRTWGEAVYVGNPIGLNNRPSLVCQKAALLISSVLENLVRELPERSNLTPAQQRDLAKRLLGGAGLDALAGRLDEPAVKLSFAHQRRLAVLRTAASSPRLLCLDEPTAGLPEEESRLILDHVLKLAQRRAILIVLHNQAQMRYLGGVVALLAGGMIQEQREAEAFFANPETAAAKTFVRTGSCAVASPQATPEELDGDAKLPPPLPPGAKSYVSESRGPRGFLWLIDGRLAGTPRPGIIQDIDYDCSALRRVGVTVLISLTSKPVEAYKLREYGIRGIWSPIRDMYPPSIRDGEGLCGQIQSLLSDGEVIAVHCKAGLGRTGTVLAAYLIWIGQNALDALENARRIEPRWVQSERQVLFLERFEEATRGARPGGVREYDGVEADPPGRAAGNAPLTNIEEP